MTWCNLAYKTGLGTRAFTAYTAPQFKCQVTMDILSIKITLQNMKVKKQILPSEQKG
jgi:hypothetical protein